MPTIGDYVTFTNSLHQVYGIIKDKYISNEVYYIQELKDIGRDVYTCYRLPYNLVSPMKQVDILKWLVAGVIPND